MLCWAALGSADMSVSGWAGLSWAGLGWVCSWLGAPAPLPPLQRNLKPASVCPPACLHLPQWPQASESQVAAAEALVQSLLMPHFESASIQNPALQRHFQVSGLGSE